MTTALDLAMPRTVADLQARYAKLQRLIVDAQIELTAVEEGLRVAGVLRAGRPRKRPTHTVSEAREAHRLHQLGDLSPWVQDGERQYQRDNARARRSSR
jgi:hypothetical protein